MSSNSTRPVTFLLHDGALDQVRQLLRELDTPFVERIGDPTDVDHRTDWDLVIASQKRINGVRVKFDSGKPCRIAILDNDSRTLRSMLRRHGIDFVVARPVHPAALRLLILHCLYRGPEKRNRPRVSIGAPVQCRAGLLRRFDAVLADLSLQGCRLVCRRSLPVGKRVRFSISGPTADGKPLALRASVQRCERSKTDDQEYTVAMRFEKVNADVGQRIRKTMAIYERGPARLERTAPSSLESGQAPAERRPSERRTTSRHEYEKRIVALGDEATRVLLCRDISLGGMRVEPNESLVPGDALKVAIHVDERGEPLVVNARVERDDGDAGLVLGFKGLGSEAQRHLRKMVDYLPIIGAVGGRTGGREAGLVVSEILERRAV